MKYGVSVTDTLRVKEIEENGLLLLEKLSEFSNSLSRICSFKQPRGIIFHDMNSATELYSTIPLPAYTSRDLIHITPLVDTWRKLFLTTSEGIEEATTYYKELSMDDIAVIAAHELTHHADFFHSDFEELDEENMWFEEGMCFYIPRKLILSSEKYETVMDVESSLIEKYKDKYGEYTLDRFGESAEGIEAFEYSAVFYDYWRSTIVVGHLIKYYCQDNIQTLIEYYKEWADKSKDMRQSRLQDYFKDRFQLSNNEVRSLWWG
ncbi:hypothetical protein ACQ0QQ_04470 [Lysinibacillus sphaericus]